MTERRLVDYLPVETVTSPADEPAPADAVEQVFEFPDRPQPTVQETVKRMVREVIVPGEVDEIDEYDETFVRAEQMEAPTPIPARPNVAAAFDRGARLTMPPIPEGAKEPATKPAPARSRKSPGGRPAGSDEFTDLFAAGLITLIAFAAGDEFQPTADEAKDIARPLGNIMARRIDLAKKLGQDANDVIAFSIALMAYGVRVGPIATSRVREAYDDRQRRSRVDNVAGTGRAPDGGGTNGVFDGADAGPSSIVRPSYSPVDAIAQARNTQFGVIGRDLTIPARRDLAVGSDG